MGSPNVVTEETMINFCERSAGGKQKVVVVTPNVDKCYVKAFVALFLYWILQIFVSAFFMMSLFNTEVVVHFTQLFNNYTNSLVHMNVSGDNATAELKDIRDQWITDMNSIVFLKVLFFIDMMYSIIIVIGMAPNDFRMQKITGKVKDMYLSIMLSVLLMTMVYVLMELARSPIKECVGLALAGKLVGGGVIGLFVSYCASKAAKEKDNMRRWQMSMIATAVANGRMNSVP